MHNLSHTTIAQIAQYVTWFTHWSDR